MRIILGKILFLDGLEDLQDGLLRVSRLLVENVCHQLIEELVDAICLQVPVDALNATMVLCANTQLLHLRLNFLNLVCSAHFFFQSVKLFEFS